LNIGIASVKEHQRFSRTSIEVGKVAARLHAARTVQFSNIEIFRFQKAVALEENILTQFEGKKISIL